MVRAKQNRRSFLRAAGGLAAAGLCGPALTVADMWSPFQDAAARPSRIAVFFENGFPGTDDFQLGRETIALELKGAGATGVDFLDTEQLASGLSPATHRLFINPYGSAFPESCWSRIRSFLSAGGHLLNLGGVPFSVPVGRNEMGKFLAGHPRTDYHRELGITQAFTVPSPRIAGYRDVQPGGEESALGGLLRIGRVHELYVKFTSTRDYPGEDGTSGQRDAVITAVVEGTNADGDPVAAPVVEIDRFLGEYAGGKWILANFTGALKPGALRELARRALVPVIRPSIRPAFATYLPGEVPSFTLGAADPSASLPGRLRGSWSVTLTDGKGEIRFRSSITEDDFRRSPGGEFVIPRDTAFALEPGLHTLRAIFRPAGGRFGDAGSFLAENGFWIMDRALLAGSAPLSAGERYFTREGDPYPVVGTSYMSGTVQRKFLFEPDPANWERDFRQMKEAGINLVRTGIWTGWKNVMLDVGSVNEAPLRALDAFVLTAARHGIPVIFTFFAFLPESWGGENPYLDPRSMQAQSTFLSTIARRYADAPGVSWDIINEPSFCSPAHLWECRPNYDAHEREAWRDWIGMRSAGGGEHSRSEWFRLTTGELPGLPAPEDFTERNLTGETKPFLAAEYRMFAQERFRRWVRVMADVLRKESTGPRVITVGQDEGATSDRPGPHFFADEVDYTSMHNWWYNDDLLWDTLMTTVPGKANLIEETGVMFYETAGGTPWRTEEEVRDLVERKLAISFASGAAGFVNWLWNTNPYMDSDNEAGIGLKRADGTRKPEFDSLRRYARFFSGHARLMKGKEEEESVMVIPHSNLFSNRNTATAATRACVRAMEYHCRTPLRAVSEYGLHRLDSPPPLIVLPSPVFFDNSSWAALLRLVDGGSTLLISGPFDRDPYALPAGRMGPLGLDPGTEPVGTEEFLSIDDKEYRLGFRGEKIHRVEKCSQPPGTAQAVSVIPSGRGRIVFSPVPLELSDSIGAVAAFYRKGIAAAGVTGRVLVRTEDPSVLVRTVVFRDTLMVSFVPEGNVPRKIDYTLIESGHPHTVTVPARRPLVHFYGRSGGDLLAALEPPDGTH